MRIDPAILPNILLIPLLLVLLAFDVAAEVALTNISRLRLTQLLDRGVPRARALAEILNAPRLQNVLRVAILLTTIAVTGLVVDLAIHFTSDPAQVTGALVGMTFVALTLSVLAPQAIAVRNPERAALLLVRYVALLQAIIGPPLSLMAWLAGPLVRFIGGQKATGHFITEEEMRQLLNTSDTPNGVVPPDEEEMIQQIFAFSDTVVREVMVPRTDIVAVADTESLQVAVGRVLDCGHTRLPVYHETMDNIIGIINAKDLLRALHQGQPDLPILTFVREAHFIPETKKVDDLLRDLQRQRLPIAIVVDEYGGTAGLVTIEDLVEEIVGEIQDEYDREPVLIEPLGADEWRCDARLPLDDLNELLGTTLEGEAVETVGGLVQERLGHIPQAGESIRDGAVTITVLITEGLRVKQLRVERTPPTPPAPPASLSERGTRPLAPAPAERET
jgi:CBS domain containing-hemolysin-like protein